MLFHLPHCLDIHAQLNTKQSPPLWILKILQGDAKSHFVLPFYVRNKSIMGHWNCDKVITKKEGKKNPSIPGNLGNRLSGLHNGLASWREHNKSNGNTPECWQSLYVLMKGNYFEAQCLN